MIDKQFKDRVYELVSQIPKGKVMTYGQIAYMCGSPRSARIVGGIAHYGDTTLPWQRVVMKDGGLASGFPGGVIGHESMLRSENVEITDGHVNMAKHLWHPIEQSQQ